MVFISESGTAINLDRVNCLFKTRESRDVLDPETGEPIQETYFEVWASFTSDDGTYIDEFKTEKEAIDFIRWLATEIEPSKNPLNYDDYRKWLVKEAEKNGILRD